MAEPPRRPKSTELESLLGKGAKYEFRSPESKEEQASRLRREEAEEVHKRRMNLILHSFVMSIIAVTLLVCAYIAVAKDPRTSLPDKAMGIIMAIVGGAVGYLTGKASKSS